MHNAINMNITNRIVYIYFFKNITNQFFILFIFLFC